MTRTVGLVLPVLAGVLVLAAGCISKDRGGAPPRIPAIWPVGPQGRTITSSFGTRKNPVTGRVRTHKGLDIAARKKSPVAATAAGTVSFAGKDRTYGKYVVINHGNGMETRYAHLRKIKTKRGVRVKPGHVIGKVGKTGRATGPHLHYEVWVRGKPVDPKDYLPR